MDKCFEDKSHSEISEETRRPASVSSDSSCDSIAEILNELSNTHQSPKNVPGEPSQTCLDDFDDPMGQKHSTNSDAELQPKLEELPELPRSTINQEVSNQKNSDLNQEHKHEKQLSNFPPELPPTKSNTIKQSIGNKQEKQDFPNLPPELPPYKSTTITKSSSKIDLETEHDSPKPPPSESDTINQFLCSVTNSAEARLLARRAARAEAREIRMRDLERQQREQEENADRQFDMLAEPLARRPGSTTSRYLSSRRSSEDSLEDTGSLRDLRHELKEVEEKFRKAMIANAQLDNDKAAQTYQLELLKDRLEELEEEHFQLKREHKEKCRDTEQLKRLTVRLREDLCVLKAELEERDRLIEEKGLVIIVEEEAVEDDEENGTKLRKALVSKENAEILENAGEGSLDVRLARFAKDRGELQDQISHLKLELEEEKNKRRKHSGSTVNGPNYDSDHDAVDLQRETTKQLAEYKFRAQKAEQDVATLQATVARLESQVIRYKSSAEVSEKSEEALKLEKRKLQREVREAQSRAEELEMSNSHLIKRFDKLKNAKSAFFKEL